MDSLKPYLGQDAPANWMGVHESTNQFTDDESTVEQEETTGVAGNNELNEGPSPELDRDKGPPSTPAPVIIDGITVRRGNRIRKPLIRMDL